MPPADFTLPQANDLAKHFLGKDWFALQFVDRVMLTSDGLGAHAGDSWRAVFRAAGVHLPLRPQFVAKTTSVLFREKAVCTAVSATMAKRIAAALNEHITDRRGI